MKTIKFKKNNLIVYSQDFMVKRGLPSNIEFTIEEQTEKSAILSAPGYGGVPYGNGKIYIYRSANKSQILSEN